MDDLDRLCVRLLGDDGAGRALAADARRSGGGDRVPELRAALAGCREHAPAPATAAQTGEPRDLAAAVAAELAAATARLPAISRAVLALRELSGCDHAELAAVTGVDDAAGLLAEARLRLQAELRGVSGTPVGCAERDRALRAIARRQDDEPLPDADADWIIDHLGECAGCAAAHAAMLEAAACYRAWAPAVGAS